ncbi:MAG: hypothetical protein IK107_00315, partial [Oscillospiraceae bacterium]|nr:hypothetical protein [Oscillospiraceae bacterium]
YAVTAHMEYAESAADLLLTRQSDSIWDAEFSAPASLAGVLLHFDGNAVSASYQGLQFTVPKSAMPAKTMLIAVTEVLDSFAAQETLPCAVQEDGTWQNTGNCSAGSYTVTFDANGVLAGMELPDQPVRLTFREYVCVQENAPAGTAESIHSDTVGPAVQTQSSSVKKTETQKTPEKQE